MEEVAEYIHDYEGDEPDIVIFQSKCNDIETKDEDEISQLNGIVSVTKKKFVNKDIIISLPLPRIFFPYHYREKKDL